MTATATSLKLPKSLKERIARIARRAGESPHAVMLRLLEAQVDAAERFESFAAEAREVDERMQKSGVGYGADEVHEYLESRIAGGKRARPKPVAWRK